MALIPEPTRNKLRPLPNLIFASRWLQLPLYLGLILAQGVYVFHFWVELVHLIEAAFGNQHALELLVHSIGYHEAFEGKQITLNETVIMLVVLGLIDVVMISNLLIMVIVGGYETFVSRMNLEGHPDQPEWLDHVNASVLKVKLATAIIGISSIHLLKTFINAENYSDRVLIAQTVIHLAFLFSAMAIALTDKLMHNSAPVARGTELDKTGAADGALPMHSMTPDNRLLAEAAARLAQARRCETPPLHGPRAPAELQPLLGAALTPEGIGGEAALALFQQHIVPASISNDHPGFLAFIPHAPTEAAICADALLSAFPTFTGAWNDGAGLIASENAVLRWLADAAGLPASAGGCFVPGATVGTLSALHAARHAAGERPAGGWALLASREAHASVAAAARVMDVELIEVDTDTRYCMTGDGVRAALAAAGQRVFAVVASAGATNLGVIDDLPGIAAACRDAQAWLHVDAAYGGGALASPRARTRLAGIEGADSLVVDPHKWLFAPYDSCALLFRDPGLAAPALAQRAEYIDPAHAAVSWNPFSYGIHLSRRARGFPLWFSLATYGSEAYAKAIDDALALTAEIAAFIRAEPQLELAAEPMLSVLVFFRRGWTAADCARWSQQTLQDGTAWIAPTSLRGAPALRLCILNPRASFEQVRGILIGLRDRG